MQQNKNVLIVYAHQTPSSFNCALKDVAVKALTEDGCNVQVSDLYAMQFKATATKDDIVGSFKNMTFSYAEEAPAAYLENRLSSDIAQEIEKVKWADLIIFQFPIYILGLPAIMKGWFDRVLLYGFAFSVPSNLYERGLLQGKRAILSCTTGGPEVSYRPDGVNGDISACLWPIERGGLSFSGFSVLQANVCYEVQLVSDAKRKKMLDDWGSRVVHLFEEEPKYFFKLSDFKDDGAGLLNEEALQNAVRNGQIPAGHALAVIDRKIAHS